MRARAYAYARGSLIEELLDIVGISCEDYSFFLEMCSGRSLDCADFDKFFCDRLASCLVDSGAGRHKGEAAPIAESVSFGELRD